MTVVAGQEMTVVAIGVNASLASGTVAVEKVANGHNRPYPLLVLNRLVNSASTTATASSVSARSGISVASP